MSAKEKKIAKLEQTIKTAQLDMLTLKSKPVLSDEEKRKLDISFFIFVVLTIAGAFAFDFIVKLLSHLTK